MKRFSSVVLLGLAIALVVPGSAASIVYSDGGVDGTLNAWTFSDTDRVANSFVSTGPVTVTGFDVGIWTYLYDYPTTVTWEILTGGPDWMGGTVIASGDGPWSNNLYYGSNRYLAEIWGSTDQETSIAVIAPTAP